MSRRVRSLELQRARFDDRAEEPEHKHKKAPRIRSFFDARPRGFSPFCTRHCFPPRAALPLLHAALSLAPAPFLGSVLALAAFVPAPFPPRPYPRAIARSAAPPRALPMPPHSFSALPHAFTHVKNASFAKILALGSGVKYNLFRRAVPSGQAGYELFHHGS